VRDGDEVFRQIQRQARSIADAEGRPAPTSELLTRHALESFLDRLTRTEHANDFVLKGGILLGAYDVRRPTKDVDAEAVSTEVSAEHVAQVVRDLSEVDADDGLLFDLGSLSVQEIREQDDYPGLRVRVKAWLGTQTCQISWDISTGDPIVPSPRRVSVPRVMGEDIEMWGYAPETIIAEKGVTILERGITSTRWRDYVDIVRLAQTQELDPTNYAAPPKPSPATEAWACNPSGTSSTGTGLSVRRNGRPGDARREWRASAKRTSTSRWPTSRPHSTRSSTKTPPRDPRTRLSRRWYGYCHHPRPEAEPTTTRDGLRSPGCGPPRTRARRHTRRAGDLRGVGASRLRRTDRKCSTRTHGYVRGFEVRSRSVRVAPELLNLPAFRHQEAVLANPSEAAGG
jgi:hypothetical protein